ncbi:MAG: phosphoglycerate kinase [Candidatus Pacebacteria bacterium]|nr:phosphoglycerate kinase [Candidatus Paceibacterota bacterium]
MFLFSKSNRFVKVVTFLIIQAFLITIIPLEAIAEKQESVFKADCLAPQLQISVENVGLLINQYNLLSRAITGTDPVTVEWQKFEETKLAGKPFNQQERNLAQPQKIAFNIDTFAANTDVSLASGLNRIFDSIFRLLEGNPNFAPTAIFLGDYADGMPASMQRLAEFLNSNPFLGNANYRVGIRDNKLVINGLEIPVYSGLAKPESLEELGIDFLVDATRQRYLENVDLDTPEKRTPEKLAEEKKQAERVRNYLDSVPGLNVVVLAPEEDKGDAFGQAPLSNRINTETFVPNSRLAVMAEPVTVAVSGMVRALNQAVKQENPRAKINSAKVEVMRTDRQPDGLIDRVPRNAAAGLTKIFPGLALSTEFASFTADTAVPQGANAIRCVFRINGRMPNFDFESINNAFRQASKKGLIAFADEPTVSSFETFNPNALVFRPITKQDLKTNYPSTAAPYQTVALTGYYSETGYANQVLDFMTGVSLFKGNKASARDKIVLASPKGTIPNTAPRLKLQVVPDGEPIQIILNSVTGRMSVGLAQTLWNNPNFQIVGTNGFRANAAEIVAALVENDNVYRKASFTLTTTADGKSVIFTDRAERVTWIDNSNSQTLSGSEDQNFWRILVRSCYGNLIVTRNRDTVGLRLHGKDARECSCKDNKDGTYTAEGLLENGTKVRATFYNNALDKPFGGLISVGITKREIVSGTNIRAPRSAYVKQEGETEEKFSARRALSNQEVANQFLVAMPQLNGQVLVLEASGALKEPVKFAPFLLAGAGRVIVSAPAPTTDVTIVPGVSFDEILSAWDGVKSLSGASCTTSAAATGVVSILDMFHVLSGYFNTIHAVTRTQEGLSGGIGKNVERSVDGRRNIVYTTTGAFKELGRAIKLLEGIIGGISVRVGNDNGSLVNYELQVEPGASEKMPSAEEINAAIKLVFKTPYEQGGLAGFLGYGTPKTSLEIIGAEFGGIFDPKETKINKDTGTLNLGIWYDNERGFLSQYVILALFEGLRKKELDKQVKIVAQNVTPQPGAYTGMTSVESAKEAGAEGVFIGSGRFRAYAREANTRTQEPVDVGKGINKTLTTALEAGFDLPILNVFFDADKDQAYITVMSTQIRDAFAGLAPTDIIKTVVSLEIANAPDYDYQYLDFVRGNLQKLRQIIANYVEKQFLGQEQAVKKEILRESGQQGYGERINGLRAFVKGADEQKVLQKFAALLGSRVADKVRIVIKASSESTPIRLKALALKPGVDGIIDSFDKMTSYAEGISVDINNSPDKLADLVKRAVPRFLLVSDCQSNYRDKKSAGDLKQTAADNPQIEFALMPNPAQAREASAIIKGEKVPDPYTLVDNVPVRVLLQNSVQGLKMSGFVDLEAAIEFSGAHDVLLRHSEVLKLTGVSDKKIAELLKRAHMLKKSGKLQGNVIVAVGETEQERDTGSFRDIVIEQLLGCVEGLTPEEVADTVVAYEPRWAIGQDAAKPEDIKQMHQAIRAAVRKKFGADAANRIRIIYGGNLNSENAESILGLEDVDGGLIGGASRDPEEFAKIVHIAEQVARQKKSTQTHWRKMYIAGNQKDYEILGAYPEFISPLSDVDRSLVEVALGPKLTDISLLTDVYTQDPLKDIVTINQLPDHEIKGKEVFLRVDFNTPIDDLNARPLNPDTWEINSFARIDTSLPMINYVRKRGGIVILVTHFEPKGVNLKGPQSVEFLVEPLSKKLETQVKFVRNPLGSARREALVSAKPGDVILFENLRLDKREKSEDPVVRNNFAKELYGSKNAIVVHEGFGIMGRKNGSVTGKVPGVPRVAGIGLAKELRFCVNAIRNAKGPKAFVMGGGSKMKDKIPLLRNIIQNTFIKGDKIYIYGAAALPFLMAANPDFQAGNVDVDPEDIKQAKESMELAERKGVEIVLPVDFVVADSLPVDAAHVVKTKTVDFIPAGQQSFDIGPKSIKRFINDVDTNNFGLIVGNGPAGVFEYKQFRVGTQKIFEKIAAVTQTQENPDGAITIFGGGDTVYAAELTQVVNKVSYPSSGGGAFLKLLQGEALPGVEALRGNAGKYRYLLNPSIPSIMNKVIEKVSDYAARKALGQPFGPEALTPMKVLLPRNQQSVSLIQSAI